MKCCQSLLWITRTTFYTTLWWQQLKSYFSGVGRSSLRGLIRVPCCTPISIHASAVIPLGCWGDSAFPSGVCLHNVTRRRSLCLAECPCGQPDLGFQKGSCWKGPMSVWQWMSSSLLDWAYLFLPEFVWFMNCLFFYYWKEVLNKQSLSLSSDFSPASRIFLF